MFVDLPTYNQTDRILRWQNRCPWLKNISRVTCRVSGCYRTPASSWTAGIAVTSGSCRNNSSSRDSAHAGPFFVVSRIEMLYVIFVSQEVESCRVDAACTDATSTPSSSSSAGCSMSVLRTKCLTDLLYQIARFRAVHQKTDLLPKKQPHKILRPLLILVHQVLLILPLQQLPQLQLRLYIELIPVAVTVVPHLARKICSAASIRLKGLHGHSQCKTVHAVCAWALQYRLAAARRPTFACWRHDFLPKTYCNPECAE